MIISITTILSLVAAFTFIIQDAEGAKCIECIKKYFDDCPDERYAKDGCKSCANGKLTNEADPADIQMAYVCDTVHEPGKCGTWGYFTVEPHPNDPNPFPKKTFKGNVCNCKKDLCNNKEKELTQDEVEKESGGGGGGGNNNDSGNKNNGGDGSSCERIFFSKFLALSCLCLLFLCNFSLK